MNLLCPVLFRGSPKEGKCPSRPLFLLLLPRLSLTLPSWSPACNLYQLTTGLLCTTVPPVPLVPTHCAHCFCLSVSVRGHTGYLKAFKGIVRNSARYCEKYCLCWSEVREGIVRYCSSRDNTGKRLEKAAPLTERPRELWHAIQHQQQPSWWWCPWWWWWWWWCRWWCRWWWWCQWWWWWWWWC